MEKNIKETFEKFDNCKVREGTYCQRIDHDLENGYAILLHCGKCLEHEK